MRLHSLRVKTIEGYRSLWPASATEVKSRIFLWRPKEKDRNPKTDTQESLVTFVFVSLQFPHKRERERNDTKENREIERLPQDFTLLYPRRRCKDGLLRRGSIHYFHRIKRQNNCQGNVWRTTIKKETPYISGDEHNRRELKANFHPRNSWLPGNQEKRGKNPQVSHELGDSCSDNKKGK